MKFTATSTLSALAMAAQATNHIVLVAQNGGINYSPSSVTAAVGDTIEFQFASNVNLMSVRFIEHRIILSHKQISQVPVNRCQEVFLLIKYLMQGIWSGFIITTSSSSSTTSKPPSVGYKRQLSMPSFTITVNDTNPTFFYCAQVGHCQLGMVFALNPSVSPKRYLSDDRRIKHSKHFRLLQVKRLLLFLMRRRKGGRFLILRVRAQGGVLIQLEALRVLISE